jgi:dienelactone hydrolase
VYIPFEAVLFKVSRDTVRLPIVLPFGLLFVAKWKTIVVTIDTREVSYQHNGISLEGALAFEKGSTASRPAVLVLHGMEGRSEYQLEFAKKFVEWGYVGFAVDLYGKGAIRTTADPQRLMMALMQNRMLLKDRLLHVVEVVRGLEEVEPGRIAAIGFCFGGLCALDLARTGIDLRAVASFHGVLNPPGNVALARMVGTANKIKAKVIVFHGWEDPFAPPEDVLALGRELSGSDADWQIHAYGKTMHSFMAPGANSPEAGIMYNEISARRALASLKTHLSEAFT